ncbi:5,10-methylenetetrahydromethanopterin reductase [Nymphon striatum]|nr:5,10-methylenetetrahydromethanopterin reductase [Nymphon striatum]
MVGGPAVQSVHLGAAHPLLPPTIQARSPDELFAHAVHTLRGDMGSVNTLLVVDDINQVDLASAALVRHLVSAGVVVVATVRSEGASNPFVQSLWKDGLLERVDIGSFDQQQSVDLISSILGPATAELHDAVFALCDGNALFTRELIADGRASSALREGAAGWELVGELRAEQRLADLFVDRLASLPDPERELLELVALAEPTPLATAQALAGPALLERLNDRGLVSVVDASIVRASHPMLGEVARRQIPPLRVERLIDRIIETILTVDRVAPTDVLRAVRWQIERGTEPDPRHAAQAAMAALALFDGETALACARASLDEDSPSSQVLLGRAQFINGQPVEAAETLRGASQAATTAEERTVATVALSEVLTFGLGDFAGAASALEATLATVTETEHRAMLAGTLGLARALTGDFETALTLGDELLDTPDLNELSWLNLALIWTIGAVLTGRLDKTQERLTRGTALARAHRAELPAALDQMLVAQVMFDIEDGRIDRAMEQATAEHDVARSQHRLTTLWDVSLSYLHTMTGNGAIATRHAQAAVASVAAGDPLGVAPLVHAAAAMAHAAVGDSASAMTIGDLAEADPRCGPREQGFLARAKANVLALDGNIDAAIEACTNPSVAHANTVWDMWAIYDAVRLGRAQAVVGLLRAGASRAPVESVLAMTQHAEAHVAQDAALLAKASDRLLRTGFVLFAAEAAAHASLQLETDGDATGAAAMALRSLVLFGECTSMRSLAVESLAAPLTAREREIATAAAAGTASKDIADQLFVSRRTVDNHLQNALHFMVHPFRFGIQLGPFTEPVELREYARKVQDLGYSELFSADHLGAVDPFLPLLVAAEATTTLRFGPLVLNNEFHNPAMLARTAASFDVLTGGRLVLGMGTGYMQSEHDAADIPLRAPGARVTRFGESIDALRALLDDGTVNCAGDHITLAVEDLGVRPAQSRVPILMGGYGKRVVTLAGHKADIYQFTGLAHDADTGAPKIGGFALADVATRHGWLKQAAAERFDQIELSTLVQQTKIGAGAAEPRDAAIERMNITREIADQSPFMFFGSEAEVIEQLLRLREDFGIHHVVTRDPDDFAPIVAALAGT